MMPYCPKCTNPPSYSPNIIRHGSYYRSSDGKSIRRFKCLSCRTSFSLSTLHPCYKQKKRHKNDLLRKLLCSGVSQRRAAKILSLHRTTIARKFLFLATEAKFHWSKANYLRAKSTTVQFDDLETFEHTKCKPLSVTLFVEESSRWILGLKVSRMPAKGRLASLSRKKYGRRKDERKLARKELFAQMHPFIHKNALIKSDSNPHYLPEVSTFFPKAQYKKFLGKRGASTGQGELKRVRFDPLFSLNHTCAKLRADINRLFRKTWCTTKSLEKLEAHLNLYAYFHNQQL